MRGALLSVLAALLAVGAACGIKAPPRPPAVEAPEGAGADGGSPGHP